MGKNFIRLRNDNLAMKLEKILKIFSLDKLLLSPSLSIYNIT